MKTSKQVAPLLRISIHALRAEGDAYAEQQVKAYQDISIHALRAEGDLLSGTSSEITSISIHALRAEGDPTSGGLATIPANFYPRPPCGGRPIPGRNGVLHRSISIHALRAEGDG